MRLERIRDAVRQELGHLLTMSTIDNGQIDHAIAQSLIFLANYYPSIEEALTVAVSGPSQNLKTIQPLIHRIEYIRYPYDADFPLNTGYPYSVTGSYTVAFSGVEPQVGETLQVTYKPRYTIADLYSATTTTLPDDELYEHPLVIAAAGHILYLEGIRRTITNTDPKIDPGKAMKELAGQFKQSAIEELNSNAGMLPNPAWSYIGL